MGSIYLNIALEDDDSFFAGTLPLPQPRSFLSARHQLNLDLRHGRGDAEGRVRSPAAVALQASGASSPSSPSQGS